MVRINKLVILIVGVYLINALTINAQEQIQPKPLSQILSLLQTRYQVQFNYAEDIVVGILLPPPSDSLSFEETLHYLRQNTDLSFTLLNDDLVLVASRSLLVLCGYLKSKENALPISSATIQGLQHSTISDERGFFELHVTTVEETITIRHIGFNAIVKTFGDFGTEACMDVFLEPQFQNLSEVVISDYISNGINKLSNGSFVMNFSNFGILPGLVDADVLQAVQAFPGILSSNETVSNINIRGGTHDQNLILWDGIKMYQSGHFFGLISMYNPQITQKVTLTKNGTDVSYTDGTSGSIAMQTETQVNSNFKGSLGVNFTDVNGFADVPIGSKSSLQIAARKSISDYIETPTYKAFFNRISQNTEVESNSSGTINSNKMFDFYDTSLRWRYDVSERDQLRVNFINVSNELQFNENTTIDNQAQSRQSNVTQNSIAEGLQYIRTWSEKLQTTFELFETDYKLKAVNANILDAQRFLQENKVSETSVKLKANVELSDKFTLMNGYQFVETEVTNLDDIDNPIYRSLVSEVLRTHGLFSQFSFRSKSRNTNLISGLRVNYIDKFGKTILEPRLSFNQRFLGHFTFEVLGELKHQNTSQVINFQNDFLGIEKRRWQLSNNRDIPIIRSRQVSTGLNYNQRGWLVSAEAYYKNVRGISSQSQGFLNQYEFVRANGSYKVLGVDFLIRKRIDRFNTWVSYSFMDNTYRFIDLEPKAFPSNYNIEHSVAIGSAFSTEHLKIAAGLNWHSGKPTTHPVSGSEISDGRINYDSTNGANLSDYMRLDLSALYRMKMGRLTEANLGVSVWNVLDRKNVINSFYRNNDDGLNEIQQRSLGFTPNVVLRVFFN